MRLRNVRKELKHDSFLADILFDFAKARIRTDTRELRGKNAKIICGGVDIDREICIEHDGAVKCTMCWKKFDDLVAMLNHLVNARRNNLQAINMQLEQPAYHFRFDAHKLVQVAAAAEIRYQPAEENNVPLRK